MPHEENMGLSMKQRLQAVLARYGADPTRWPAVERDELLPYLEEAGDALDDARLVDRLLDLAPAPALAAGLERRLMARLSKTIAPARFHLGWSAALPLAASLVLGIYLGAVGALDELLPSVVTDDIAAVDDDDDSGVSEATDYSGDQLS